LPSVSQCFLSSLSFQKAIGRALQGVKILMGVVRFGRVRDAAFMKLDKLGKVARNWRTLAGERVCCGTEHWFRHPDG